MKITIIQFSPSGNTLKVTETIKKEIRKFPIGVWIAFIALFSIFFAWMMQAFSLYDWETAYKLGLQNGRFNGDALDQAIATKEKGEAIADLIWALPLTIIAFIGLIRKKLIGFIAAMMTFAICVYFPLFYIFQLWDTFIETAMGAVILWGIPSIFGIVGLWVNREILKN